MPNKFHTGRAPRDAQMKALQKPMGQQDRSTKTGPDIRNADPTVYPGPKDVASNQTATDKR